MKTVKIESPFWLGDQYMECWRFLLEKETRLNIS